MIVALIYAVLGALLWWPQLILCPTYCDESTSTVELAGLMLLALIGWPVLLFGRITVDGKKRPLWPASWDEVCEGWRKQRTELDKRLDSDIQEVLALIEYDKYCGTARIDEEPNFVELNPLDRGQTLYLTSPQAKGSFQCQ